jgi:hypothetical protein
MDYNINITRDKYYKASLAVINCWMNLTGFELDLLAMMLKHNIVLIDKLARTKLKGLLDKDNYTFNNYIKKLKNKKVLIEDNNKLMVHPNIITAINDPNINIKFNISDTKDS